MCRLARLALRAESGQVEGTEPSADVAFGAQRSQWAESPVVVFAGRQTRLLAHVLIQAVVAVGAVAGPREGLALGHAPQVVFVEILALQPLLAKPLEKMFAH